MKVLIVEDDPQLGRLLGEILQASRYTVVRAVTCAAASDALAGSGFDLVVLDLGLPDGAGLDLLRSWRRAGFREPVLILSARDSAEDKVAGLDAGADDYLGKPFDLHELHARVRSLVRRHSLARSAVLEHAGIEMHLHSGVVVVRGEAVDLTQREYAVLEVFMHNPGRVLPRKLISEKVWSSNYDVDANLLDVYMGRIRSKLEKAAGRQLFKTVRGVGYQLV
ncbi:response regulator transcription factor [Ramlibacter algicola]|uniref:Response regulator transcription factor n=1 Tax=Ramlibacter algicola TaxID=2795217 RepID=A0A934URJ4_9BURK|nr:response regulator transcription factor [Ramlibacter algicola]MBK0392602.1 response regulator transcription factor [Ramlibacter algicola]